MKIHHVALWSRNIQRLAAFYAQYFEASPGDLYVNEKKGFSSIFLRFSDGASLELMNMASIPENPKDPEKQHLGFIHLAISVGSVEKVDAKTEELRKDGYGILSEPRWTGDGYYESCVCDPDGNRIEITL